MFFLYAGSPHDADAVDPTHHTRGTGWKVGRLGGLLRLLTFV
ncbi:MAG TPA: hypothetical protein VHO29_06560 [Marmoricola sp.]|nr:hypothetical protein [Marmoricola sp.]